MLSGRVDDVQHGKVSGWAFNDEQPSEHLLIRVMRGPQVIASGVANITRRDLPDAGVGDGDHAFSIDLPPNVTSSLELVVVAQSQKAGEIILPIATSDERAFDRMFAAFSGYYEQALIRFKEELDDVKARCLALETTERPASNHISTAELPDDLTQRLTRLESRMEAAELFFVRIDESVRKLVEGRAGKRKRFLGIF
jgi:hypothetical protein